MSEKRSVWELFLKDSVSKSLSQINDVSEKMAQRFSGAQAAINNFSSATSSKFDALVKQQQRLNQAASEKGGFLDKMGLS